MASKIVIYIFKNSLCGLGIFMKLGEKINYQNIRH